MTTNSNEKEKLLVCKDHDHHHDHHHDHAHYGSSTPTKTFCPSHDPNADNNNKAAIGDYLMGLFKTQNTRTSVAPCCACGTCNHETCQARKRQRDEMTKAKPVLHHCSSSASLGSYNHPTTPTRSRCNSSESVTSTKMDPTVDQTIVRSTIGCKGICCSSEVPELLEILTPVHGIAEVKVNVPLKSILIDHDSRIISATQIVDILEEELFPSTVERDGGASLPSIVRSTFSTKGICCSSEVPFVLEILTPYDGVFDVKVVVPVKQVVVDHDCKVISAAQIAAILCDEEFETTVTTDGGASKAVVGVEGRSKFHVGGICCSSEIPAIRTILEPLTGVKGLLVTVATKMVSVCIGVE